MRAEDANPDKLSWDHFGKVLHRAGVAIPEQRAVFLNDNAGDKTDERALQRLIDHLDPEMTGEVNWLDLVHPGRDSSGSGRSAPYFFTGALDLAVRNAMKKGWGDVLQTCSTEEAATRKAHPEQEVLLLLHYYFQA